MNFARHRSLTCLVCLLFSCFAHAETIVITGGTLIDVSNSGLNSNDITPATVIMENDRILYAGPAAQAKLPFNAKMIDAKGKYLVPGLIEGFGSLQSQGFANAYLYEGVTSVYVTVDPLGGDTRRGKLFEGAHPGPRVIRGGLINSYSVDGADDSDTSMTKLRLERPRISNEQITQRMESMQKKGVRCVLIHYNTWPDQVDHIVREARRLGMGTMGELGFTSYPYAARAGVGAFVHTQKYLTELVPFDIRLAWTDEPFGPAGQAMNLALWALDPDTEQVRRWGKFLAASKSYLMPTESIAANAFPGFARDNPWLRPAAKLIAPDQLFRPINRTTGEPESTRPKEFLAKAVQGIKTEMAVEKRLHEQGARFLAASGTSAFGVMPGGGMHQEMQLLVRYVGLTPREALAAATSNYAAALNYTDIGEIREGRRADVLVLASDPRLAIEAVEKIDVVIAQGVVIDRAGLLNWTIPALHPKIELN